MSVLGKYRKSDKEKEQEDVKEVTLEADKKDRQYREISSVPNKERKSPIMSFSIAPELRYCLQAIRQEHMINLSMWVERRLREAIARDFPNMSKKYLD